MKNFMLGIVVGWIAAKNAVVVLTAANQSLEKIKAETA